MDLTQKSQIDRLESKVDAVQADLRRLSGEIREARREAARPLFNLNPEIALDLAGFVLLLAILFGLLADLHKKKTGDSSPQSTTLAPSEP